MKRFSDWRDLPRAVARIEQHLARIEGKVMSTEQNLQDKLDAIKALVQKLLDAANGAPAGPVSQSELDALNAEADSILGLQPTPAAATTNANLVK